MDFGDLHKLEDEEECKEIEEKYLNEKLNNIRFKKLLNMRFENEKFDKEEYKCYLEEAVRIIGEEICGSLLL